MALIKCPECGKEISSESSACIHCGFPLRKTKGNVDKPLESHVVAYRGSSGFGLGKLMSILSFVFSPIFVLPCILGLIAMSKGDYRESAYVILKIMYIVIIAVGGILIILGLMNLLNYAFNKANKHNCIEYDANENKIVLYTLYDKKIVINPEDYIDLKDNFMTDNALIFSYKNDAGRSEKVNLGFCSNRNLIKQDLDNILNRKK